MITDTDRNQAEGRADRIRLAAGGLEPPVEILAIALEEFGDEEAAVVILVPELWSAARILDNYSKIWDAAQTEPFGTTPVRVLSRQHPREAIPESLRPFFDARMDLLDPLDPRD